MESKPAQMRSVPACFFGENLFGNEGNLLSAPRLEKREGGFSRTVLFGKTVCICRNWFLRDFWLLRRRWADTRLAKSAGKISCWVRFPLLPTEKRLGENAPDGRKNAAFFDLSG